MVGCKRAFSMWACDILLLLDLYSLSVVTFSEETQKHTLITRSNRVRKKFCQANWRFQNRSEKSPYLVRSWQHAESTEGDHNNYGNSRKSPSGLRQTRSDWKKVSMGFRRFVTVLYENWKNFIHLFILSFYSMKLSQSTFCPSVLKLSGKGENRSHIDHDLTNPYRLPTVFSHYILQTEIFFIGS